MQAVQNGVPAAAVATLLHTMDEAQAFEELPQTSLVVAMAENNDGDVAMMVLDAMLEHIPVRQVREPSTTAGSRRHHCTEHQQNWPYIYVCCRLAHVQCTLAAYIYVRCRLAHVQCTLAAFRRRHRRP